MGYHLGPILTKVTVCASAPCRIDMGGTLDISTFYLPMAKAAPCTFNIAMDLRTHVRLLPYERGMIKVSSKGFETAAFPLKTAPFDHPLGLIFAAAAYFDIHGVHLDIHSTSPPKGSLGGSSAAVVAIVAAFSKMLDAYGINRALSRKQIALVAQEIEQSVAGVPCGLQDQLAAAFGGVHAWHWQDGITAPHFIKKSVCPRSGYLRLEESILVAYCGKPHASKDINGRWIKQFLSGQFRPEWKEIARCCNRFVEAFGNWELTEAVGIMNRELDLRKRMTPDVLDDMGVLLETAAKKHGCGIRFTGAGGGGCIWALGPPEDISRLRTAWNDLLSKKNEARLLDFNVASEGVTCGFE
jgi:D-glycero-alpha-D-manno-heptose-7-phosphate kinase